jgi:hypothetical protein
VDIKQLFEESSLSIDIEFCCSQLPVHLPAAEAEKNNCCGLSIISATDGSTSHNKSFKVFFLKSKGVRLWNYGGPRAKLLVLKTCQIK